MLANIFGKSTYLNLVYTSIFLILFYGFIFFFSERFVDEVSQIPNTILIVALCLFFLAANFFASKKNLLTSKNDYAILILLLLMTTFSDTLFNANILCSNLFLMFAFYKLYKLSNSLENKKILFDASFYIGIATLFFSWSFLFFVLVYASILFCRCLNIKTIITSILGFCTPVFLYFSYHFFSDSLCVFHQQVELLNVNSFKIQLYDERGVVVIFTVMLLTAIFYSLLNITKGSFIPFKTLRLLIVHFVVALFVSLVVTEKDGSEILFLLFPTSIFIANQLSMSHYKYRTLIILCYIVNLILANIPHNLF
jgi:hypothetical protein